MKTRGRLQMLLLGNGKQYTCVQEAFTGTKQSGAY